MAKNTQGWKMPTGKEALEALQTAKPMAQVYEENFAKAVAETTKQILQQNQKQKAAVATAAQPKQTTTAVKQEEKTTKQKYEDAKKALSDYTSSDDYRAKEQEKNRDALQKAQEGMFATGIANSETPRNMVMTAPKADAKEQELKALVEHYKQQMEAEENQRVRDADMQEIDAMSEEDREQLRQYISNDSKTGDLLVNSNPLLWFKANKALGDSAKYLFGKYGEEKTKQLASTYSRVLNEKEAEKIVQDTQAAVDKSAMSAVGQNILGVGTRLYGGLQATADRFGEALDRDERYSTLAPVTSGDLFSVHGNTVTERTAQNIAGEDGGILRQGAAYLYQGGMTMVDSFARVAVGGGPAGSAAIAACNAFSQTVSQASQQGATPEQAYTLGAAVAGVEYLSEKIPMDEVFKVAKTGDTKVLLQAFKQAGIEISTEELSMIGSMAAEAAILREKSSYKQQIGDLIANGASYEEAKKQADKTVWEEAKQTALVSGFSGFISGGGAALVGNLNADSEPEVTTEAAPETAAQAVPAAPVAEPSTAPLVEGIQDMTPTPAPLTEGQRDIMTAMDGALGVQPVQQPMAEDSTVINTDPTQHTPQEQATIDAYQNSVDDNLVEYIQTVKENPGQKMPRYPLKDVDARAAEDIKRLTGIDVSGNKTQIEARAVEHILKRHGENGKGDQSMRDVNDIGRIQYVIDNYDSMEHGGKSSAYVYQNEKGRNVHAQTVILKKKVNGTYFVVEAVPDTKKKTLFIVSAYMSQNGQNETAPSLSGDAEAYRVTPDNATKSGAVSNNSIPESVAQVNENPVAQSDYYDEFEDWGKDPNREGVEDPLSDRSYSEVGKRSVKAYMYENPAVKPFYQEQAAWLLSELADSTKGGRTYNEQLHYESGGEQGWSGTKRHTSESIAELLDQDGMTYDQIERGLNAIVNDHGQENNAVSKRIEFVINDRLMNGYTDFYTGQKVPGNAEYLDLLRNQQSASDVDTQQQSAEGGQGIGAAEENFSGKPAYNATLSADNAQADRRDDVRPMELPQQDINGGNVSAVTGNVYGSRITPDDFASLMEEPTAKGDFTYAKITNDQATQRATETIASAGTWENAYDSWKQSVSSGNAGAEMSARGALFLNHAAQQGDKQLWLETLHYMQKLGTNTAQGLQAFRIIRTLQPADKIEFVRMSVEKMAAEVKEKHGIDLEIDQTLIDEFEQADTDEARDAVLEDIQQNVADQIPSTFLDKWTALRYMNMLGNLKTNVRNIAGNVGSSVVYRVKDTIATGMESIVHAVSGGKTDRTKSLFVRKSLLDACKKDFQQFTETVSSGGKYGDRMSASSQFEQGVQDKRKIFKNPLLEGYRKGTNWMMNNKYFGDEAFGRTAYSRALAGYLQANGVNGSDLSKVDTALLDKARAYAIKEAQEATFHDNSALARVMSKVQKDTGIVGQGLLPFTKTPANVLTRAEEFSPLGLINSTVKSVQKAAGNENVSGADVINSWAKTITGTGLFALGAAMMEQGLLIGGPDEDEEKAEFDKLNGYQSYAIRLPNGTNYTFDWLTPAAMPMFMGAQFWKMLSSDRDLTFADMEQVFTSIADPMIQMSMLQGLNDSLDSIKHTDNNLGQFFINAAVSYLTQGLTNTLMGQIERSTEENRQTTYIDKNSNVPEWMQRQLGKASQKIPGWDFQQMDYRNAWGQTQKNEGGLGYNLLSPGYLSKEQSDKVSEELYRLRESTGENVFPQPVGKTVSYTDTSGTKHTDHALTQKELDIIQRVEGETAARLLAEVMDNEDYTSLTDTQRAEIVSNVYKYAQEQSKKEALTDYYSQEAAWIQNMGDNAADALIQKTALDYAKNSMTATQNAKSSGFSDEVQNMNDQQLRQSYDVYSKMSQEAKTAIREESTGTMALYLEARDDGMKHKDFMYLLDGIEEVKPGKSHTSDIETYLEIRDQGVTEDQFLSAVGSIAALKPEGTFKNVRDIQQREAIANLQGVSERAKDALMKAYMDDGDSTEAKYDYCRKVLDLSPREYVQVYRVQLDGGNKNAKIAKWKALGYTQQEANVLYRVFSATGKTKIDTVDWADSWK